MREQHTVTIRRTKSPGSRRDRRRPVLLAMVVLLFGGLLAALPLTASTAATTTPAVSAATDPANGFPLWYQDSTATRLTACLDPNDAVCGLAADAGFDPTRPEVFPTNFPSEFFYGNSQSDRIVTPGCKGAKPGRISILDALEGAFVNGAPKFGDQMVFGRERLILTGGLCPKSTYQVNAPYGHFSFVTDTNGALAKNQGTTDIGCAPLAPNVCDFSIALTSPQAKNFLRWDPAVAPAAPSGYLGDGATLHRIVGGTNANALTVTGPGANGNLTLTTNLFTVMGKLAGPLSATPSTVNFGGVAAGATSPSRTVTVSNLAPSAVTPTAATLTGPNAADFAISSDGCAATAVATDATCPISVTFQPAATASGPRSASLVVGHNSFGQPLSVPLSGTATAATEAPGISVSPSSIDFGQVRIVYGRADQDVTVTNTGTAPLDVTDVRVDGGDAPDFSLINRCTDPVAPGATCLVNVAFAPTVAQARSTTLKITSNATPAVTSVSLSGTGTGGHAAVSSTNTLTYPDWYQDEAGVRLDQCLDPTDPECLVLPGGTFDGSNNDLSVPGNFPDEFFWYDADADVLQTPGCNGTAPGKLRFRFAVEGAFANDPIADGDQMTFGRMRVQGAGGLCPTHDYHVVTPYGSWTVTTDDAGDLKPSPNTVDTGCTPTPGVLCDFSLALRSDVLGGFLRWDPNTRPAAPSGYLGDPNVLHTVIGAPYSRDGQPVNYVAIYDGPVDPANLVARTDKFNVMGKLGGPLVADPSSAVFPDPLAIGAAPATRTITLSNQGINPITVNGFSVSGDAAGSFSVGDSTCQNALAPGDTCTVGVNFAPLDVGPQKAALVVDHTGLNSPLSVPLSGVGTPSTGTAALSVDRTTVSFAPLHTGRTSPPQQIAVSNIGGTAALNLGNLGITGPAAASFTVSRGDCGDTVDIGATCHIEVRFVPSAGGDLTATLTVNALPPSSPSFRNVQLSGTGFAGDAAVSPSISEGFPSYYQDENGVRLAPCTDPNDGACAVAPDTGVNPDLPVSFPGNFPNEFFYTDAVSEPLTVSDTCADGSTAEASVTLLEAVEGAFVTDTPEAGQQITFGRSRIIFGPRDTLLCPTTTYDFVTPYGLQHFTTDATGALKRNDGTVDVGCAGPAAGTTTPACDFAEALGGDVFDGFLRWAPGVGIAPPAGYLGDGVTFHQVVGATYVPPGETEPANYFEVLKDGTSLGKSAKFSVIGKLASGLAAPDPADFGDVTVNDLATKTLTFTNIGTTPVAVASAQVGGAPFSVIGGTCVGSVPGLGTCTVQVSFAPTSAGPASTTVSLLAADGTTLASDRVTGNALAPTGPQIAVTPAQLTFAAQAVGTSSAAQQVTVRNTGGAGLNVLAPTRSGAGAADYTVTVPAACQNMAVNATCQVGVVFRPTATGSRPATLTLNSNAAGAAPTVALTGTGTAALIQSQSATLDLGSQKIGKSVTKTFVITNGGTAPLTITAVSLSSPLDFTANPGTCTTAVAPGKNCQISISFTARAPAGLKRANLTFASNAANSPTLPVTGTSK